MRIWCSLLFTVGLSAQTPAPLGIVRGNLVEIKDAQPFGELAIRTQDERVYRFQFNHRTYVERGKSPIKIASLQLGERTEILCDVSTNADMRYARIVHVQDPNAPPRPVPRAPWRTRPYVSPTEQIVPRGDLTFSGVVRRLNGGTLLLRTRIDGDKHILLRPDTRYLDGGELVEGSALRTNARIFVRAGRNLEGDIEAYQVIWGRILEPDR